MKRQKLCLGAVSLALIAVGSISSVVADTPPASPPPGSTLQQRIDQRKSERNIVFTTEQQQRVVSQCVNAQGKLRTIQRGDVTMLQNHTTAYNTVNARLWLTIGQLKLANQDTFHLEQQQQAYLGETGDFQALVTNYEQALDDVLVINCQADPVAFQAMLDTVRLYYTQLAAQSGSVRNYIVNTLKPTLSSASAALQSSSDGDSN